MTPSAPVIPPATLTPAVTVTPPATVALPAPVTHPLALTTPPAAYPLQLLPNYEVLSTVQYTAIQTHTSVSL